MTVLAGVGIGLVLVLAFFLSGRLPVRVGPDVGALIGFALLLMGYALRVLLLLVALVLLRDARWLDARALGLTVIVGALLFLALQLRQHLRAGRAEGERG